MADWLIQIIQWAIPSGGLGVAIGWFLNRSQQQAESAKAVHNAYKEMYEDISMELVKLNSENNEIRQKFNSASSSLQRAVNRLSRAIEAIQQCPYRAECPVRTELSDDEGNSADNTANGTDTDDETTVRHKRGSGKRNGSAPGRHGRTDVALVSSKGTS